MLRVNTESKLDAILKMIDSYLYSPSGLVKKARRPYKKRVKRQDAPKKA